MQRPRLGIEETQDGARHTLALTGELDLATATPLEEAVARLCRSGASEIVPDLPELAFLDSTGFRAILSAKRLCEEHGCDLSMTRARKPVQRVFDVSGMLRRVGFRSGRPAPSDRGPAERDAPADRDAPPDRDAPADRDRGVRGN